MQNISPIDWIICISYLLVVVGLGFYFSKQQTDNDEYFFGGRHMHWLPVGLSLFAATFSLSGSWFDLAGSCRSAFRYVNEPGERYYFLGFRLVAGQEQEEPEAE